MEQVRRQRGDLEQQILALLAGAERPMTAADVRRAFDPVLAYSTGVDGDHPAARQR